MLTKKEIVKCVMFGLVVVGLVIGGELLIAGQLETKKKLEEEAKGGSAQAAADAAAAKKKEAKQAQGEIKRWKTLLVKVQKYFPKGPKPPISNEQVARASATTATSLVKCDKKPSAIVEWMPPAEKAEGEEESEPDEEAIKQNMIKYAEDVLQVTLKGDYAGFIEFLVELEKMNAFYQFKELKIKSQTDGKPDPAGPLKIEASLASYHVLEFPSDRAPAE